MVTRGKQKVAAALAASCSSASKGLNPKAAKVNKMMNVLLKLMDFILENMAMLKLMDFIPK